MDKQYLRIWLEQKIEDVDEHLLIVGDVCGDCARCKEVGLEFSVVKECPHCHTPFKYISSRNATGSTDRRFHEAKRILHKRSDLTFIDYDDYKKMSGRNKAKKFFE